MSSNTRGRIYDGVYRAASNKDLQMYHYKDAFLTNYIGKAY